MSTYVPETDDPFADAKVSSVSFKTASKGEGYQLKVTKAPTMAQTTDFTSGQPAFWKNPDGSNGNPKMAAVLQGIVEKAPKDYDDSIGEIRSLWAPKPSAMYTAIADAQMKYGQRIQVGGTIEVIFAKTEKNKNPKFNDQKIYEVSYVGPDEDDSAMDLSEFKMD